MTGEGSIDAVLAARVAEAVDAAFAKYVDRPAGPQPLVVTPGEAATMLRVSRGTIGRWVDEGRLPAIPDTGTRRLIPRAAVERMVASADPAG